MNLAGTIEGIINCSEGMKPETRDKAIIETIEYYRERQQRLIASAQEAYDKGSSFAEYHLRTTQGEQALLEKVIKGETSFMKELKKIPRDPDEHMKKHKTDLAYSHLIGTLMTLFHGNFDMEPQAKILDKTIERLYWQKK
jgi:hypothetical protein